MESDEPWREIAREWCSNNLTCSLEYLDGHFIGFDPVGITNGDSLQEIARSAARANSLKQCQILASAHTRTIGGHAENRIQHNAEMRERSPGDRDKGLIGEDIDLESPCWLWTGARGI